MKTPASAGSATQDSFAGARHLSDQVLNSAQTAMDHTRSLSNDAMTRAEDTVRSLRGSIDPVVERLATQAQKLARQSMDMASQASERAQKSMHRYADATGRYVSNEPVKSVLMAAAVGAAVALLIAAARQRQRR